MLFYSLSKLRNSLGILGTLGARAILGRNCPSSGHWCAICASSWCLFAPWPIEVSAGTPFLMSALAGRQPSRSLRVIMDKWDVRCSLIPRATMAAAFCGNHHAWLYCLHCSLEQAFGTWRARPGIPCLFGWTLT